MTNFLHVAFGFAGKNPGIKAVQDIFGAAGWARYAPNCWIVTTDETPQQLAERLRAICDPMDSVFVCPIDINNKAGYLHKDIWDWFLSERKRIGI